MFYCMFNFTCDCSLIVTVDPILSSQSRLDVPEFMFTHIILHFYLVK